MPTTAVEIIKGEAAYIAQALADAGLLSAPVGDRRTEGWLPIALCPTDGLWRWAMLPDGTETLAAFDGVGLTAKRRWQTKEFLHHTKSQRKTDDVGREYSIASYDTFVVSDLKEGIYPTHFRPNDIVPLRPQAQQGEDEQRDALKEMIHRDMQPGGLYDQVFADKPAPAPGTGMEEMAREWLKKWGGPVWVRDSAMRESLTALLTKAREMEREFCAQIAEGFVMNHDGPLFAVINERAENIAEAIRAYGVRANEAMTAARGG